MSDIEKLATLMMALEIPPSAASLSQHEIRAIGNAITRQARQSAALSTELEQARAALREVGKLATDKAEECGRLQADLKIALEDRPIIEKITEKPGSKMK